MNDDHKIKVPLTVIVIVIIIILIVVAFIQGPNGSNTFRPQALATRGRNQKRKIFNDKFYGQL